MNVRCKVRVYSDRDEVVWYSRDIDWCCQEAEDAHSNHVIEWSSWIDDGSMCIMEHSINPREDPDFTYSISHCPWCGEQITREEVTRVGVSDGEEFPLDTR